MKAIAGKPILDPVLGVPCSLVRRICHAEVALLQVMSRSDASSS